jgi:hypothetical protein
MNITLNGWVIYGTILLLIGFFALMTPPKNKKIKR